MSCQEFESISVELARGQLLDAAQRESARAHAASCQTCAVRLRRERALTAALREVGASMREMEAPARVEVALRAALRERRTAAAPRAGVAGGGAQPDVRRGAAVAPRAPRLRRALFAAAVAASLVVIATIAWRALARQRAIDHRGEMAESKQSGADSTPQATRPAPPPQDAAGGRDEEAGRGAGAAHPNEVIAKVVASQRGRGANVVRSSGRRRADAAIEALPISFREDGGRVTASGYAGVAELTAAADFVMLGMSDNSMPLDSGQMVRVQVPRAALAVLGLPVNASRTGESVKADVLLAHDGTARAIRLLP